MNQNQLWSEAGWPSVLEEEDKAIQALEASIRADQSAIRIADNFLQMSQSGAYKQFLEELSKMQLVQYAKAMNATTDREATKKLGRCEQLSEIHDLAVNFSTKREALAKALQAKQDELAALRTPNKEPA